MLDVVVAAKYVVTKCYANGAPVNSTQLQNLLYLVDEKFYNKTGDPLFRKTLVSKKVGAVYETVRYFFSGWGVMKIMSEYDCPQISEKVRRVIDAVVCQYGKLNARQLVDLVLEHESKNQM